ncbi:pneumococcal surface protein PspC, LPXTG-anchored form [Streptococcus pneumoniae]|nr:pneumococcal surface protein PspC, LPXTG-anchored form [Streptococcus pneumoniae]
MFKSNHERRMRYSIRKFSVGVASVAVASLFMGSVVHATEKEGSTQAATSFNRGNGSQAEQRGERDKAMKAVSEYVGKMVRDAYVKSDRKRHKNTVALVNQLGNIKNRYLNEIVHSTSKSQLQELMMKSQSEVDEAVSKFEKDSFSSSSSGSSTKPETPQPENPEHQKPTTPAPDTKSSPQPEGKKPSVPDINQEKEKAKLAVATYMSKILDDIQKHHLQKEKHRQIVALIKELDELKKQALSEIDNVNTKVEIENTVHKIFADMDAVVTKFKKGLTQDTPKEPGNKKPSAPKPGMQPSPQPEVKPQLEKPKPEVKPQLEKPKPEVKPQLEKPKPDNSKPQADDKKPSTTNNLSKDKQPSNQASTNEKATNKPKKSLPSTGSISNLALEIAGLLTLAGATILAKKRMK